MSNKPKQPYLTLGNHLRYLREQLQESLAEVSGAVEIDETHLEKIEAGRERPAEDILMLLISHFDMQDQEAGQLWELAGYHETASERRQQEELLHEALSSQKPVIVVMAMDNRTLYTDTVDVEPNNAGIVLNFGQQTGKATPQQLAKLGMSYEQAEELMQRIQGALLRGRHNRQQKLLPPPSDSSQGSN